MRNEWLFLLLKLILLTHTATFDSICEFIINVWPIEAAACMGLCFLNSKMPRVKYCNLRLSGRIADGTIIRLPLRIIPCINVKSSR